ncbi:SpoIIE family protein phosphatase [Chloroflexales bacterium ZM16-3]|nr:SpoIIE family protein phosphatase [Chloroflexales bacterium ZM16-3]
MHENEDAYIIDPERPEQIPAKGLLVAVLDGISSGGSGISASRAARTAIQVCWSKVADAASVEPIEMVYQLMEAAQNAVLASIEGKHGGTTCLLALIRDGVLTFAHVGDCQLMLSRGQLGFQPLTQDQTALLRTRRGHDLQQQVEQSQQSGDTLADEKMHDYALLENTLTRYLGMRDVAPDPRQWVEVGQCRLEQSDVLLLCSDGLLKAIAVSELRYGVADVNEECADALLSAVARGQQLNRDDTTFFLIGVHATLPAVGLLKQYAPTFNRLLGEEEVSTATRRAFYATITEDIHGQPEGAPAPPSDPHRSPELTVGTQLNMSVSLCSPMLLARLARAVLFLLIALLLLSVVWLLQR